MKISVPTIILCKIENIKAWLEGIYLFAYGAVIG